MPNHVAHVLRIRGSKKDVAKIREAIRGEPFKDGSKNLLDFNKIIPMPKELEHVTSPVRIVSQEKREEQLKTLHKYLNDGDDETGFYTPEVGLTEELSREYIAKFGANNWYDWTCKNWTTKWNAYSMKELNERTIYFETAWSTPTSVLIKLSKMFPETIFQVQWADEDRGHNCGKGEYKNGQFDDLTNFDEGTPEARKFANKLHRI